MALGSAGIAELPHEPVGWVRTGTESTFGQSFRAATPAELWQLWHRTVPSSPCWDRLGSVSPVPAGTGWDQHSLMLQSQNGLMGRDNPHLILHCFLPHGVTLYCDQKFWFRYLEKLWAVIEMAKQSDNQNTEISDHCCFSFGYSECLVEGWGLRWIKQQLMIAQTMHQKYLN